MHAEEDRMNGHERKQAGETDVRELCEDDRSNPSSKVLPVLTLFELFANRDLQRTDPEMWQRIQSIIFETPGDEPTNVYIFRTGISCADHYDTRKVSADAARVNQHTSVDVTHKAREHKATVDFPAIFENDLSHIIGCQGELVCLPDNALVACAIIALPSTVPPQDTQRLEVLNVITPDAEHGLIAAGAEFLVLLIPRVRSFSCFPHFHSFTDMALFVDLNCIPEEFHALAIEIIDQSKSTAPQSEHLC
ncbi:hypothetical protein DFH29DRAFT_1067597 [Suillus ampliporus]|nr:hypothetical protein DFH29DRAFT_1067597 [Suillus ampliporus]